MIVRIDDARPGMVLEADVILPNGSVLVPKDCGLTQPLLTTLKKRHIAQVQVVDPDLPDAEGLAPDADDPAASEDVGDQAQTTSPPILTVTIATDRMSATLRIDPSGENNESLTAEQITTALAKNKVLFGIDEILVRAAVARYRTHGTCQEIAGIAKGLLPAPGREGGLQMVIGHIKDDFACRDVRGATYYWQASSRVSGAERVDPGTVIARRAEDTPPHPGTTVTGEELRTDEMIRVQPAIDASVTLSADGRQIFSASTGVPFCVKDAIGVIPLNFDGTAELTIRGDRMEAHLLLHEPGPGGAPPAAQRIEELLSENGIMHGVNEQLIRELVEGMANGKFPVEPALVAQGTPPRHGENGKVEFLFDTNYSLKPKANSDGTVDFKNLSIIKPASIDAELARLNPPTPGVAGSDIGGREIPARNGVAARLPVGINTLVRPERPDLLVAAADGNIQYNGRLVDVTEIFYVKGNVDYATGHITYPKTVAVKGDVISGFNIDCGGDLEIDGTLEDSTVVVAGNVLLKHGFLGLGKGNLDATGEVNIGFIHNQTVRSRKGVSIAKEALNATIHARNSITVHGRPLSVAGGTLIARDCIDVYAVGNASQTRTVLEVGTDYVVVEELKKNDAYVAEISASLAKLTDAMKKLKHVLTMRKKLPEKQELLYSKLGSAITRYQLQLEELEGRKKLILSKMYTTDTATIRIAHSAMPGTVLKIGDRHYPVVQRIDGPKTVRLIKGEIHLL